VFRPVGDLTEQFFWFAVDVKYEATGMGQVERRAVSRSSPVLVGSMVYRNNIIGVLPQRKLLPLIVTKPEHDVLEICSRTD